MEKRFFRGTIHRMMSSCENPHKSGLWAEIRLWIWAAWLFWFLECLMLYFQVTFYGGAWALTEGWGIVESDLAQFSPFDVLIALVVDFAAMAVFCFISILALRLIRRFYKNNPISAFAFHGAVFISIILFLYGAVIINVVLAPLSFNPREQVFTFLLGVACALGGVLIYRHAHRLEPDGTESVALSSLACAVLICLFGVWPLLEYHTPLKWQTVNGVLARAGIFAFMLGTELLLVKMQLKRWRSREAAGKPGFRKRSSWNAAIQMFLPILIAVIAAAVEAMPPRGIPSSMVNVTAKNPPNVLIVSMDTVRADALSCYSPATGRTPFIDSIAARGVIFEQARSPSPWTLPGHASMFTSLYPSVHGADWEYTYLKSDFVTLAEILKAAGYQTAAFSSNVWVSSFTNVTQGFDYLYLLGSKSRFAPKSQERPLLMWEVMQKPIVVRLRRWGLMPPAPPPQRKNNSEIINDMVGKWFSEQKDKSAPSFVFVNYMNAHHPYNPPGEFRPAPPANLDIEKIYRVNKNPFRFFTGEDVLNDAELDYMKALYYGAVSYEDEIIKRLFAILERNGFLKNAIVIIVADHGEYLGEHEHFFGITEPALRVPFIIYAPGKINPGLRYNGLAQTLDIPPTLLELIGIAYKGSGNFQGKSLVKPYTENIPVRQYSISELMRPTLPLKILKKLTSDESKYDKFEFRSRSITNGQYQLEEHSDGYIKLWKLGEDVTRYSDVTYTEPQRMKLFKEELDRIIAGFPTFKSGGNEKPVLTPELRKKLKALDYME